ncbi:MAG: hypothetical protein WBG17_04235 [Burkholderiaceae bacterium]
MRTPALNTVKAAIRAMRVLGCLCAFGIASARAEEPPQSVVAPVLFVYATQGHQQKIAEACWQTLVTERQLMLREEQARPWLLRNAVPLIGTAMGAMGGSYLLRRHASALNAQRFLAPAMLGGGLFGFVFGPAGVVGGFAGGLIGDYFGKHKFPAVLGGGLAGAAIGKTVWDLVFPPVAALEEGAGGDELPLETFLREKTCGAVLQSEYGAPHYRVTYRFDGDEYTTDLPYDPGEALLLDASGQVQGPARVRIE